MSHRLALRLLQGALGIVLCLQGLQLAWTRLGAGGHSAAFAFLLALGVVEAVAGALFLAPRFMRAAGVALLVVLAAAAVHHLLLGEVRSLGTLAIDAAGVACVLSGGKRT